MQGCHLKLQQNLEGVYGMKQPEAYARGQGQTTFTSGTVDYSGGQAPSPSMGQAPPPSGGAAIPPASGRPAAAPLDSACVKGAGGPACFLILSV
jgi:hypothetical protein